MERLEAFEKMLSDIIKQADYEKQQMEKLKAEGKDRDLSPVFRQPHAL